jgi:hypothetical protein
LNDGQRLPPAGPEPGEQNPECPIHGAHAWFSGCPLEDMELVTEGQILHGEGPLALER